MRIVLVRQNLVYRCGLRRTFFRAGPTSPPCRTFGLGATGDDEKTPRPVHDSVLRSSSVGVGQVIFLNSENAGKILLASLAIGDPLLAAMAALGTATSSATAIGAKLDNGMIQSGLYSYNGCLVGCAASVFLYPTSGLLSLMTITMAGAASATFATASLSRLTSPMPQWTYAFNMVTLAALFHVQPLMANATESATATIATSVTPSYLLLLSPFTGLSQIFVVESALSGLGIVAAIASYSPALAAHAVMGSITGSLVGGLLLGASAADISAGLYGYNAALTSMGVAFAFVPTRQAQVLSIVGAAATTVVFAALKPVFASTGSPCLTVPFCLTMSMCWTLGSSIGLTTSPVVPGLLLASSPHSPEKNAD